MQFTNLLGDDDAVSPVIGVILMVAITVILAAVIGTFVLGLGDQVSNTSPTASFTFDFTEGSTTASCSSHSKTNGELDITHDGGDKISGSQLQIAGNATATNQWNNCGGGSDVTAGSSITVNAPTDGTVRVTWQSSNGDDTATLGKWTGPTA
jgi:flagellin-like protein